MLSITRTLLAASSFLIFLLFFLHLHLLLLPIGLAPRNRRCPVICLDHQIKPSVSSSFSRGVTSLPTICLLTKRRRRRPLLCLSTASLHILLARSGGFKADQVAQLILVCFFFVVVSVPLELLLLFLLLPNSWKIVREFKFFFFGTSSHFKDPQKTPHLMRLFVTRKVSEQWWWCRRRRCVL